MSKETVAATSDALALSRAAMLERCDISISRLEWFTTATSELKTWYEVRQGDDDRWRFDDEDLAFTFAYELAGELIDQGDLHQ